MPVTLNDMGVAPGFPIPAALGAGSIYNTLLYGIAGPGHCFQWDDRGRRLIAFSGMTGAGVLIGFNGMTGAGVLIAFNGMTGAGAAPSLLSMG